MAATIVLFAVAAAVIGGASLFGGRGRPLNVLLGGLVIAVVANGLGLMGVSAGNQRHHHSRRADRRRHAGRAAPESHNGLAA